MGFAPQSIWKMPSGGNSPRDQRLPKNPMLSISYQYLTSKKIVYACPCDNISKSPDDPWFLCNCLASQGRLNLGTLWTGSQGWLQTSALPSPSRKTQTPRKVATSAAERACLLLASLCQDATCVQPAVFGGQQMSVQSQFNPRNGTEYPLTLFLANFF